MGHFRKRPVVVEARQFTGDNAEELIAWAKRERAPSAYPVWASDVRTLSVATLEGTMRALPNDWIIKGVKGEFYPCKPDIFEQTYEPADPKVGDAGDLEELPQMAEVEAARKEALGTYSEWYRKAGEKVIVALADAAEEYARTGTIRGVCQVCGCTELDCRQCVEKTGKPCHWVDATQTLCSACAQAEGQSETGLRFMVNALPFAKRDELAAKCGDIPRDERVQIANHHGRGMGATWHLGVLADKDEILRDIQADADLRDDCALLFLMVELNRAMLEVEKERA
ncbi:MAG: hypothetical protein ICCCNLDF_02835 [Planctomycetes bacterium]|nr:hypothetical protein [Planctomycetota bacterium]